MLEPKDNSPRITPQYSPNNNTFAAPRNAVSTAEQATIGRTIVIKGEVTGSEPLYVDGRVEGSINIPESRVTVGRGGSVSADINAKEVVIMGKVQGNVICGDRVDIRAEGSLTGDVVTPRISVEDGAFLKGAVDIQKSAKKEDNAVAAKPAAPVAVPKAAAATAGA
jgi:cytoskeletal protein CcmA (bactofilin family)